VILDLDPGIDDAVALVMALFDPRLEVLAVTATGGNVPPEQIDKVVPKLNAGVSTGFTVTVNVVGTAHCPAVGVNV
jgi:inosine-uridine nucleoside N-ribohydrolase